MKTYADYANDAGLGFGFGSPNEDFPTLRRASDSVGSEIYFICSDNTLAEIEDECSSDDYCCPDPRDDDDDQGLIDYWAHVENTIKRHVGTTFNCSEKAEQILENSRHEINKKLTSEKRMKNNAELMEKQKQYGRILHDKMQKNLSSVTSATDAQLQGRIAERNEMASMFGGEVGNPLDCEGWRQESRETQDKLDRQGREAFAQEYAETQMKNLSVVCHP